jgi:hypothetical protein
MASQTPPNEFLCPITLTLMHDPVIGPDGHSYERSAILQWLQTNPHSPLTRQPMTAQMLQTNYSLKTAIERYTHEQTAPRPKYKIVPRPQPSAPPALPVPPTVVEVHLPPFQQPLLPVAVPVLPPPALEAQRRQKLLGACVCFIFTVILIIIISRLYGVEDN